MKISELKRADGKLEAYAWPGGYPIIYVDGHNSILCPECATKALEDEIEKFRPVAGDIYSEGPSYFCDECNKVLESAYGDPDEDKEQVSP